MENWISKKTSYFYVWSLQEEEENLQLEIKNKALSETENNLFLSGISKFLNPGRCNGCAFYLCFYPRRVVCQQI